MKASDVIGSAGAYKTFASLPRKHTHISPQGTAGRISADTVAQIESELDAEYVPFYFHDLRTNEIISFHAFLDNLEDSYAPQYESATAYGRIDSVRTYIATERTITLQFKIAATSKDDFDFMWWKINKLTTLVYPSWTKGRQVASGDSKFIQPFSQVPASTPVIRMRIGDVIRSNFSKLGLSRLFGAGLGDDQFNISNAISTSNSVLSKVGSTINDTRERMLRNPAVNDERKDGYFEGETAILLPKRTGYDPAPNVLDEIPGIAGANALLKQNPKKKLIITSSTKVKIGRAGGLNNKISAANVVNYGDRKVAFYTITVSDATSNEMQGKFIVTHDDLLPDPDQVIETGAGAIDLPPDIIKKDLPNQPSNPFDPDSNIIVKSFQSSQGKGLGGVITGLTLTDLAAPNVVWETSEFGARAPKMINVSMTFAVIHDIAPGIDEQGFNRAFQYPVGDIVRHITGDNTISESDSGEKEFTKKHQEAARGLRNSNAKGSGGIGGGFPGGL